MPRPGGFYDIGEAAAGGFAKGGPGGALLAGASVILFGALGGFKRPVIPPTPERAQAMIDRIEHVLTSPTAALHLSRSEVANYERIERYFAGYLGPNIGGGGLPASPPVTGTVPVGVYPVVADFFRPPTRTRRKRRGRTRRHRLQR